MAASPKNLTQLLRAWSEGDQAALDELMPLIYQELKRIAAHYLRRERLAHTLQTTALVNEAYLKLAACDETEWNGRAHFFGAAAQAMRRILVDHARKRNNLKHGGEVLKVSLAAATEQSDEGALDLVALDDALQDLAKFDPRKSRVVELRYFGGLSVAEAAFVLGVSEITVMRDWNNARAWLLRALSQHEHSTTKQ
ncbi:MAG: sigma-70 family RNA polymerase sigma factor [Acidobacteria bacterium]|nr:sigma-70 family RNA polymerase sigma factor [Acidobacteriota bacterium]